MKTPHEIAREAAAHLYPDCSNAVNVIASALTAATADLQAEVAALREALDAATTSLCTIAQQSGRTEELRDLSQIRGYAFSRYSAAIDAARAKEEQP